MGEGLAPFTWRNVLPPLPHPATPGDVHTCAPSTGSRPRNRLFFFRNGSPRGCGIMQARARVSSRAAGSAVGGGGCGVRVAVTPQAPRTRLHLCLLRQRRCCQGVSTLRLPSPRRAFRLTRR